MISPRRAARPRLPDWEQRLHALVAANFNRPHAYGSWDCMLLAAAVIEAVTGEDLGAAHRGKYRSVAGAVRHLGRLGFADPEAMLDSLLEVKPVGFAQRGDLALVPGNGLPGGDGKWAIPGIVAGDEALVIGTSAERSGLHPVPRAQWLKAWSVG